MRAWPFSLSSSAEDIGFPGQDSDRRFVPLNNCRGTVTVTGGPGLPPIPVSQTEPVRAAAMPASGCRPGPPAGVSCPARSVPGKPAGPGICGNTAAGPGLSWEPARLSRVRTMVVSRVKCLTRWMPGCRSEAARHKRRRRTVYSRVPRVKRVRLGSRSEPEKRQMFRRRLGRRPSAPE